MIEDGRIRALGPASTLALPAGAVAEVDAGYRNEYSWSDKAVGDVVELSNSPVAACRSEDTETYDVQSMAGKVARRSGAGAWGRGGEWEREREHEQATALRGE